MRIVQLFLSICIALTLTTTLRTAAAPRYTIQDLGTLGGTYSYAWGINDLGQVVGNADAASGRHAFVWQNGIMTDLDPQGTQSVANAINDHGQAVGISRIDGHSRAYLWQNGTATDLGVLAGNTADARGINNNGDIVGTSSTGGDWSHAFIYRSGQMTDLGAGALSYSQAVGINEKGEIAGALSIPVSSQAYLYRDGSWHNIQTLPGEYSGSVDINENGQVVGDHQLPALEYQTGQVCAFLWENGVMHDLLIEGIDTSYAYAINDRGQVIGNALGSGASSFRGVMWEGESFYDLNDLIAESGWLIDNPRDINNSGQIVGSAYHDGAYHAFLMTPVAEPSSVCALLAGLASALSLSMRRRRVR